MPILDLLHPEVAAAAKAVGYDNLTAEQEAIILTNMKRGSHCFNYAAPGTGKTSIAAILALQSALIKTENKWVKHGDKIVELPRSKQSTVLVVCPGPNEINRFKDEFGKLLSGGRVATLKKHDCLDTDKVTSYNTDFKNSSPSFPEYLKTICSEKITFASDNSQENYCQAKKSLQLHKKIMSLKRQFTSNSIVYDPFETNCMVFAGNKGREVGSHKRKKKPKFTRKAPQTTPEIKSKFQVPVYYSKGGDLMHHTRIRSTDADAQELALEQAEQLPPSARAKLKKITKKYQDVDVAIGGKVVSDSQRVTNRIGRYSDKKLQSSSKRIGPSVDLPELGKGSSNILKLLQSVHTIQPVPMESSIIKACDKGTLTKSMLKKERYAEEQRFLERWALKPDPICNQVYIANGESEERDNLPGSHSELRIKNIDLAIKYPHSISYKRDNISENSVKPICLLDEISVKIVDITEDTSEVDIFKGAQILCITLSSLSRVLANAEKTTLQSVLFNNIGSVILDDIHSYDFMNPLNCVEKKHQEIHRLRKKGNEFIYCIDHLPSNAKLTLLSASNASSIYNIESIFTWLSDAKLLNTSSIDNLAIEVVTSNLQHMKKDSILNNKSEKVSDDNLLSEHETHMNPIEQGKNDNCFILSKSSANDINLALTSTDIHEINEGCIANLMEFSSLQIPKGTKSSDVIFTCVEGADRITTLWQLVQSVKEPKVILCASDSTAQFWQSAFLYSKIDAELVLESATVNEINDSWKAWEENKSIVFCSYTALVMKCRNTKLPSCLLIHYEPIAHLGLLTTIISSHEAGVISELSETQSLTRNLIFVRPTEMNLIGFIHQLEQSIVLKETMALQKCTHAFKVLHDAIQNGYELYTQSQIAYESFMFKYWISCFDWTKLSLREVGTSFAIEQIPKLEFQESKLERTLKKNILSNPRKRTIPSIDNRYSREIVGHVRE